MMFNLKFRGDSHSPYQEYRVVKNWLEDNKIEHKFCWSDRGKYLPDYVDIVQEQDATMFMMLFGRVGA